VGIGKGFWVVLGGFGFWVVIRLRVKEGGGGLRRGLVWVIC
jgi:hypothetical protein